MGYIGVRSVSNAGIQQGHDKTLSISITKSKKNNGSRNRGTNAFLQHRWTKVVIMDQLGRPLIFFVIFSCIFTIIWTVLFCCVFPNVCPPKITTHQRACCVQHGSVDRFLHIAIKCLFPLIISSNFWDSVWRITLVKENTSESLVFHILPEVCCFG